MVYTIFCGVCYITVYCCVLQYTLWAVLFYSVHITLLAAHGVVQYTLRVVWSYSAGVTYPAYNIRSLIQ